MSMKLEYNEKYIDSHKDEHYLEQWIVWVYDLYQNFEIEEDEEEYLYGYFDPEDKVSNPAELWFSGIYEEKNPLTAILDRANREIKVNKFEFTEMLLRHYQADRNNTSGCGYNGEWLSIKNILDILNDCVEYGEE